MSGGPPQSNLRKAQRQRVLKQGRMLFANNMSVMDCTIRDLSVTGARLLCGETSSIPDQFRLVTLADAMLRDVKVAWRKMDQIGVTFMSEPRRAPPRKY